MPVIGVGEEEDGIFEIHDGVVHLMRLDLGLEHGKVVDGTFAMSGGDNMLRILSNVFRYFAPGSFNSRDGVGQCTVLITTH